MEAKLIQKRKSYSFSPSLCELIEGIVEAGKTNGISLSESMVASLAIVKGLPQVIDNLGLTEILKDAKSSVAGI